MVLNRGAEILPGALCCGCSCGHVEQPHVSPVEADQEVATAGMAVKRPHYTCKLWSDAKTLLPQVEVH